MTTISVNLQAVIARIEDAAHKWQRHPEEIKLLAVSKTWPISDIEAAVAAGQKAFGENYVQEGLEKVDALEGLGLEWHFIGPLQSNKSKRVAESFDWVHSVDRLKIAERLAEQRPRSLPPLQVCLQVNVSGEETKSGVSLAALPDLAHQVAILPRLKLRGLMTIPAPLTDFAEQRSAFSSLRRMYERLKKEGLALDTLSMGMTHDLEAAIAEGATLVRVGTAIFGERNKI